jgi:hypothetical protein
VTRGIGVSNSAAGAQGLPNVDAVYTWVRLAQRIPVRISIDMVPAGVPLVSGMTATVTVLKPVANDHQSDLDRLVTSVSARLSDVFDGPTARPGCIPAAATERGLTASLPSPKEVAGISPGQINPDLTPGMNISPRIRLNRREAHP